MLFPFLLATKAPTYTFVSMACDRGSRILILWTILQVFILVNHVHRSGRIVSRPLFSKLSLYSHINDKDALETFQKFATWAEFSCPELRAPMNC